jgi:putative solute:sodium symporter small subunit
MEVSSPMIRILLLVVCVISLAVPFFNSVQPTLFGFPFFYWYQLATVPVGALLIFIVYLVEDRASGGADKK